MFILGINSAQQEFEYETAGTSWEGHDASAVLLRDAEIVHATEEERLSRIKHSNRVPRRAIRACLASAGIGIADVDLIAVPVTATDAEVFNEVRAILDPRAPVAPSGAALAAEQLTRELGVDVTSKIRFCQHHKAHLWSAAVPSGFGRCLAVSLDGAGPNGTGGAESGMVATFDGEQLSVLKAFSLDQSLGLFYSTAIAVLGYTRFDEYKVMGLAPYGDPEVFQALFAQLYTLKPDGDYELAPPPVRLAAFKDLGLVAQPRRRGGELTQRHKDFAAALQVTLERIALHVLRHFRERAGEPRLALAGGVAHNCTMNGRILTAGIFDDVFVQPAAHDAGLALGAALAVASAARVHLPRAPLEHVYLGTEIRSDAVAGDLARWDSLVDVRRSHSVERDTARLIADGNVIGWVQGRSEFGPRALGNRSILADPRPADNKARINAMVKKREGYRPFAPSVLVERMREYFRVPDAVAALPFMIVVVEVVEQQRAALGAITHVDGTARVQTVARTSNERYWNLIAEFGELTGVAMLLNTSFNNNVEPIVDSVDDAVVCFLTTSIDYLVVDDYIVSRKRDGFAPEQLAQYGVQVAATHKLVKQKWPTAGDPAVFEDRFEIQSHASSHFGDAFAPILARPVPDLVAIRGAPAGSGLGRARSGRAGPGAVRRRARRALATSPDRTRPGLSGARRVSPARPGRATRRSARSGETRSPRLRETSSRSPAGARRSAPRRSAVGRWPRPRR